MAAPATFVPMYQLSLDPVRTLPFVSSPNSPESRARDAILKSRDLSDSITPSERLYIAAVSLD